MDAKALRKLALALPEVTEQPHFQYASFRVRGKIFLTVPPDELHAHVFVPELEREQALVIHPEFVEKLMWGKKVAGVRITLARAPPRAVAHLVRKAWEAKAPKRLAAAVTDPPA
jgi:hypothetical protein